MKKKKSVVDHLIEDAEKAGDQKKADNLRRAAKAWKKRNSQGWHRILP